MELPRFRYHPDPMGTGAFVAREATCPCCARRTTVVYTGPVFSKDNVEELCPWCIASGDAAARYDAEFADAAPLADAGLSGAIIEEVTRRTPGYHSWQQDCWLTCCDDACEFRGEPSPEELRHLPEETREAFLEDHGEESAWVLKELRHWKPGGSLALYRFACRHCGTMRLGFDSD